jgi:hypothetical protein
MELPRPVNARQADAHTYHLGHFEQMQLALALGVARKVLDFGGLDGYENLDRDTLRSLEWIVSEPGTISMTKNLDEPEVYEGVLKDPANLVAGEAHHVNTLYVGSDHLESKCPGPECEFYRVNVQRRPDHQREDERQ